MNRITEIRYSRGVLSFPGTPRCKYFLSIQEAPRRLKGRKNGCGENVFFYSDVSRCAKKSGKRRRKIRLAQLKNWNPWVILRMDKKYLATLYVVSPYKNAAGEHIKDSTKFAFRLTDREAKIIQASFPPLHKRARRAVQIKAAKSAELAIPELETSAVSEKLIYRTLGERKFLEIKTMFQAYLAPLLY